MKVADYPDAADALRLGALGGGSCSTGELPGGYLMISMSKTQ